MKLIKRTWHGYYREAGEELTPDQRGRDNSTKDNHGCGNQWVRDSAGNLMNVWDCEVNA